jgi:nucleoid DNA-binding protein
MAVKKTSAKKAAPKKAASKKAAPKKAAAKQAAPKKAAPKKAAAAAPKATLAKEALTKSQLQNSIAESTGLTRKQVASVFEALDAEVNRHVKKRAVGTFTLPGLLKIVTVKKPARRARKGVPNPFRPGETMDVAAKPASTVVKIRPLKRLKDMAAN